MEALLPQSTFSIRVSYHTWPNEKKLKLAKEATLDAISTKRAPKSCGEIGFSSHSGGGQVRNLGCQVTLGISRVLYCLEILGVT